MSVNYTKSPQLDAEIVAQVKPLYQRAQAITDGALIDVSVMAQEERLKWPVAITRAAWEDCVVWTDLDSQRQCAQEQSERLRHVLHMAYVAVRNAKTPGPYLLFKLWRVPRDGKSDRLHFKILKLVASLGDNDELVLTVMLPSED